MRIEKAITKQFDMYDVFAIVLQSISSSWRIIALYQRISGKYDTKEVEVKLENIVEADDQSGLVIRHLSNDRGEMLFSNGFDDIVVDNPCKLLLLLPNVREAFHRSGFRPKLDTTYMEKLVIKYRGGPVQQVVVVKPEEIEA